MVLPRVIWPARAVALLAYIVLPGTGSELLLLHRLLVQPCIERRTRRENSARSRCFFARMRR